MLRSKGQPKRNVGPSTWPPKHTGSSDEYETDEYDPSEVDSSSDDEEGTDGGGVARGARASGQRSGQKSGGRTGGSKRNGSDSGGKKGGSSGRKKGSVDLLDSDDSNVEVHRPLSKRASQTNTKKSVNSSDDEYDTDEDEVISSRKGGGGGRSQRKALGRINGDTRGRGGSHSSDDDDSSVGDSDSEDSDALFRPKGRAPRRKAPQRKSNSDSDDSDSSDSSDSDIGMHLGRNREKELAAKRRRLLGRGVAAGCSSSDESDSASDGEAKKKPARKGLARSARAAKGTQPSTTDDSSDSDDDSSVAFLGTSPRRKPKRGAASPAKRRAAKRPDARRTPPRAAAAANKRSSIDQSFVESDDEGLPPMAEPGPSRTATAARQAPPGNAVAHDPSVRAASNAAIAKAKAAREALRAAQRYEAKEAELPAMELELPSTKRSAAARPPVEEIVLDLDDTAGVARAAAPPSYTGRMIRVALRYQHPQTKKDAKANVKIRMDQPLQHLVNEFRSQNGSLEVASMKFDGLNVDLSKTPTFYDMDDEDLIDTVVKERRGPGSRVFNVTSSPTKIQAASLGRPVRLKFRANGKASEVETISVRLREPFSSAMARFAERRNVSLAACKFIFDGEVLRPTQTPVGLDLEGDEIVDVKVPESGAPAGGASGQARGGGAASARASSGGSRSLAPAAKISFQTNRNQNNATRQKTWKVSNADPFSTLKADYMKYYKSKGCKRVVFYFRNAPIAENETRPFRNLGICGGDMLYAMENGKTYRPM